VASIAFGEAVAAADGNVRRVISRLRDVPRPKAAWLRDAAAELIDPGRPGDWNQAMMELGATICSPRRPKCEECPVARWCASRTAGTQHERPGRAPKRAPRAVTFALAVLRAEGRVLLERRPPGGLLGNLWSFPEKEVADPADARDAVCALAADRGLTTPREPRQLPRCTHRFTHLHATYVPWAVEVSGQVADEQPDRCSWVDPERPAPLALPVAQRRVLASLVLPAR
jgi:A/G-specific adenine glycosylase